jgi:hypothetical protein
MSIGSLDTDMTDREGKSMPLARVCSAVLGTKPSPMQCVKLRGHEGAHGAVDVDTRQSYEWSDPNPRSKFKAKKTTVDGVGFDSLGEAARYVQLLDRQRRGEIRNLVTHPKYELKIGTIRIGQYSGDYSYEELRDGEWFPVLEDYKARATKTEAYGLRKKLIRALYGIDILETGIEEKKKTRRRRTKPKP